jgi:hypothetical protein
MGIDFLDLEFRLERAFEVKLARTWIESAGDPARRDVQVGRIHAHVCTVLRNAGRSIPHSSWHRVQLCVAQVVKVPPATVRPESWLKELGFG